MLVIEGISDMNQHLSAFESLPVELLYEIQLYALSDALPRISQHVYHVYKAAPASFQAQYIYHRTYEPITNPSAEIRVYLKAKRSSDLYTKVLRYPLCSIEVLRFISKWAALKAYDLTFDSPELPRRLFRPLTAKKDGKKWSDNDHPLPYLRDLYNTTSFPTPNINSHFGYALTKAVQVGFVPLVQFLLHHGGSPMYKDNLPIKVAIRQKNLHMVKMLIERADVYGSEAKANTVGRGKRRKLEDRVKVQPDMLKMAVKCNATDIVNYFRLEKGCVPDMQTLYLLC